MSQRISIRSKPLSDLGKPIQTNVTRKAELEYLSSMLPQLRKMALGLQEDTLARLLEMAMMEAHLQLRMETYHSTGS